MSQSAQMIRSPTSVDIEPHDRVHLADRPGAQAVVVHVHDVRADQFAVLGDQTVADLSPIDAPGSDPVVEVALVADLRALYGTRWHDWAAETLRRGGRGPSDDVRSPPTFYVPASAVCYPPTPTLTDLGPVESPGPAPRPRFTAPRWESDTQ